MALQIRPLVASEAGALAELRQRALLDSPHAFQSSPSDDFISSEGTARDQLSREGPVIWGAFADRLVGMVGLHRATSIKAAHKARLWGLFVLPKWRRQGIATGLLTAAIDHARSLCGVTAVTLSATEPSEGAKRLYERLGFRCWGVEPAALRLDGRPLSESHMALSLLPADPAELAAPGASPSTARHEERSRARWIKRLIGEAEFERLARGLSGAQLNSLLLEVMRSRAAARTPPEVLRQFERDLFCRPALVDPRALMAVDAELFAAAAHFDAMEPSPLAPLGSCSRIAMTDQNRVLSALRSTEVVADPTNVLALECARRLRNQPNEAVGLACSQRVVRAQPVPKRPGYAPHFRLFALASAGREKEHHAFTVDALVDHVRTVLDAFDRLESRGYAFGARRVEILAAAGREELADRITQRFANLALRKPLTHGYYCAGLRYMLWVRTRSGEEVPIADGGAFDWLAKLTSNQRYVYVASGIGTQLIESLFRA